MLLFETLSVLFKWVNSYARPSRDSAFPW